VRQNRSLAAAGFSVAVAPIFNAGDDLPQTISSNDLLKKTLSAPTEHLFGAARQPSAAGSPGVASPSLREFASQNLRRVAANQGHAFSPLHSEEKA
jgi:hypothetical protein